MRRSFDALVSVLLVSLLLSATGAALPAPAAAAAVPLKVAVVRSDIALGASLARGENGQTADGSDYNRNVNRINSVEALLRREPDMQVTEIHDDDLSSLAALRQYDVVVLVRDVATVESQRYALLQYAAEGGGIVSLFSTSRYDYRPGQYSQYGDPRYYSAHGTPYFQFNFAWGFSGSSYMSQSFEYGEASELIATKFANDPLFSGGYSIVGNAPSTHPILRMTEDELHLGSVSIYDPNPQFNETVWPIRNAPITTLMNYSGETIGYGGRTGGIESIDYGRGAASHMAAWAMPFYYGKVVSYGFQLYDFITGMTSSPQPQAERMLVNSAKWAGRPDGYGAIRKTPDVSVSAWYTGGRIWTNAGVSNGGSIQVRGQLKVEFFRPGASTPFTSCFIKDPQGWVPTSPGERYTDTAANKPLVSPSSGRWVVRVSYRYYDYFAGGFMSVHRDGYLDANGTGMTWRGQGPLVRSGGALPAPAGSTELAGADRFATAAAVSRAGWPSGIATSSAVVLTSGVKFPDALAAAPLAGKLNAPILLAGASSLPGPSYNELDRLYASAPSTPTAKLYVVGAMPASIVSSARTAISRAGGAARPVDVVMLAGSDRYDTARLVAQVVGTSTEAGFEDTAFVATGANYADALSVAPVAAGLGVPIVFVNSAVPGATWRALDELGIKHAVILGSNNAVSDGIAAQLQNDGHRTASDPRLAGPSRFDTSVRILQYAVSQAGFTDDALYIATGTNYPDALALAPLAGAGEHPVLLLNGSDIGLSAAGASYVFSKRGTSPAVTFAGSTSAVSAYVRGQVAVGLTP